MNRTALLFLALMIFGSLVSGCSRGDDKAGQKTIPGDYTAEPGKGAAGEKPGK